VVEAGVSGRGLGSLPKFEDNLYHDVEDDFPGWFPPKRKCPLQISTETRFLGAGCAFRSTTWAYTPLLSAGRRCRPGRDVAWNQARAISSTRWEMVKLCFRRDFPNAELMSLLGNAEGRLSRAGDSLSDHSGGAQADKGFSNTMQFDRRDVCPLRAKATKGRRVAGGFVPARIFATYPGSARETCAYRPEHGAKPEFVHTLKRLRSGPLPAHDDRRDRELPERRWERYGGRRRCGPVYGRAWGDCVMR